MVKITLSQDINGNPVDTEIEITDIEKELEKAKYIHQCKIDGWDYTQEYYYGEMVDKLKELLFKNK